VERSVTILLNDKANPGQRKSVEVELISESDTTIKVRLPDGNIIKRKKQRDLKKVASNVVA
jgi:hypothetical protein